MDFTIGSDGTGSPQANGLFILVEGTHITAPVPGDLAVGPDESVLLEASVSGDVTIDGGTLVMAGAASIVTGSIEARNKSALGVTDYTVGGDILVGSSSTAFIQQTMVTGRIVVEPPSCPTDSTGPGGSPDGLVNVDDLIKLLAAWGACP